MATLAFEVIGATLGQSLGGTFGAALGKAAGALGGSLIDRAWIGGGARRTLIGPRLSDLDGISASEGAPIPRAYGRVRLGGQVIWATEFEETRTVEATGGSGGKSLGAPRQRSVRYTYSANVAIGLCEGPIAFVRRIWADGKPLDLAGVTWRLHTGRADQQPDPLIVAKQGSADIPAFRGLAYIVFEALPITPYGNRLPQFSFEVVRPAPGLPERLRAINIIPGSTEFGYATTEVREDFGQGSTRALNRSQWVRKTDWEASIDDLQALCPQLERATLISAWFGNDLRVETCDLMPRVEKQAKETVGQTWLVSGVERGDALEVSATDGRPNYGGTPSDQSVIEAIRDLKSRGLKVALHPFILMDIPAENALANPYSGASSQPPFPWRGRMTCTPAPGKPLSPAGTSQAAARLLRFVGTCQAQDFTLVGDEVRYSGPSEWSFRRMVLHHAKLAQAAGGVDTFFISSEMIGLTQISAGNGNYPFVQAMIDLLAELRAILGPLTRITYAADWTEFNAHVQNGGQDVHFPLDPLWAHPEIGAVAIDYYPPVSDWRSGQDHLDAALAQFPHDADYLRLRLGSGEAFDWYYPDQTARDTQTRWPITDGAYGKPWIYRAKDLVGWWSNPHVERVNGMELETPTAWQPGMKPILLSEIGCPAVDKGSNQPNVFPDPKSIENALPHYSDGRRDDVIQRRLLEAILDRFAGDSPLFDPAHNPVSSVYGGRMVPADFIAPWAFDARPFPAFPALTSLWADGANFSRGHWVNGRLEAVPLAELIAMILTDHRQAAAHIGTLPHGLDGYVIDRPMSSRSAIEPLADAFGLVIRPAPDGLAVEARPVVATARLPRSALVPQGKGQAEELDIRRIEEVELPRCYRLSFIDPERDFRKSVVEAQREASQARREVSDDTAMVLRTADAQMLAERRLHDLWTARDRFAFAIPPSTRGVEPGDVIAIETQTGDRLVQITRISDEAARLCEGAGFDPDGGAAGTLIDLDPRDPDPPVLPGKPFVRFLELPVSRSADPPLMVAAVRAEPWRGPYSILKFLSGRAAEPLQDVAFSARFGTLLAPLFPGPLWRWDHATSIDLALPTGALASISEEAALAGDNALLVLDNAGLMEAILFREAILIGPRHYRLSGLLRGLGLSEPAAGRSVPSGATCLFLDNALVDLGLGRDAIGSVLDLAVLPSGRDVLDPATTRQTVLLAGSVLKPRSPVHARARRESGGTRISFVRRARFGGDSWDLYEVPLGEDREEYILQIYNGPSVRRSVTLQAPSYFYSNADELADFGNAQGQLELAIAQVSAQVGPGTALRITLPIL
ncbi:Tip attachment protein J [Rhabdaerophilaceae bacterium]